MRVSVTAPDKMSGVISLPASKSMSNRLLMLAALCQSPRMITNIADCDDTEAMRRGLTFRRGEINIGAAGTAMRFLTAYYASLPGAEVVIDGSERMRQRPIALLVDALRHLGADIEYVGEDGYPPLKIRGKRLSATEVTIDGSVSSQYISALLMVAPVNSGLAMTIAGELTSKPYVDMTIALMRQFGAQISRKGNRIDVEAGGYQPTGAAVESDWSAASYWLAFKRLLPNSNIELKGLTAESIQGDSAITSLIARSHDEGLYSVSLADTPDLAQTLVVMLCLLDKPFVLSGLKTLRIKETDRLNALSRELAKLGYRLDATADGLAWDGSRTPVSTQSVSIDTYNDHRMAMAMSLGAVKFPGLIINDAEVVSKSYPDYWRHLRSAGFNVEEL